MKRKNRKIKQKEKKEKRKEKKEEKKRGWLRLSLKLRNVSKSLSHLPDSQAYAQILNAFILIEEQSLSTVPAGN